jgi:hypothetical protein
MEVQEVCCRNSDNMGTLELEGEAGVTAAACCPLFSLVLRQQHGRAAQLRSGYIMAK